MFGTRFFPSSLRWAAAIFLALSTTPCPVFADGPRLQPPSVVTPAKYKRTVEGSPASEPTRVAHAEWWSVFDDPTLNDLESRAATANQNILQATARIAEERQRARVTGADFLPRLEANLSAQRYRTSNTLAPQRGELIGGFPGLPVTSTATGTTAPALIVQNQPLTTTQNDFNLPLTASYELDVFGRIRHAYGGAIATAQAAEADLRSVRLSLAGDVATDYFQLRALDTQTQILRHSLDLRREQVRLNQERFDAGSGDPLALQRARTEVSNTEADLADATRQRANAENTLAALCGEAASDFRLPMRPLGEHAPPPIPAGLPADLLAHRPDVAAAERQVAAASEAIGVAKAGFLPTFTIQGSVGFETGDYNKAFDAESRELRVMPTVNVPIFEGGRNTANLRATRAVFEQATSSYRNTVLNAYRDAENALADLHGRATQAEAQADAARSAQEVLDLTSDRYGKGAIDYFDVVDAERSLLSIQLGAAQTLNARYSATVALVRALGGGWDAAPASQASKRVANPLVK